MGKRIYETLKSKFGIIKMPIKIYEELVYMFKIMIYSVGEVYMKAHFPIISNAFGDIFEGEDIKQALQDKKEKEDKKRKRWQRL